MSDTTNTTSLRERLLAEAKVWPRSDISGLLREAAAALTPPALDAPVVAPVCVGYVYSETSAHGTILRATLHGKAAQSLPTGTPLYASPVAAQPEVPAFDEAAALEQFSGYFRNNYPGPDTIIGRPDWHSPKIFRAALHAIKANTRPVAAQAVTDGLFAMHLMGPDDVYAAPSYEAALRMANAINLQFADFEVKPYAVVVPWIGTRELHASGLVDWEREFNTPAHPNAAPCDAQGAES